MYIYVWKVKTYLEKKGTVWVFSFVKVCNFDKVYNFVSSTLS